MNKRQALIYSLAKFTALFTAAVFLLTTPALLIIQGHPDALLPTEAFLTSILSAGFFFWSGKTAYRIVKI